ncbi:phosphotransferase [Rhodopseudomonas sp. BAL398]|nr:phosphotransferase [Rhodopseudomonas sp. BAL398]
MIADILDQFPKQQCEAARSALAAALGSASPTVMTPLSGGVSGASLFLCEVAGRRIVLRIEGAASPLRNPHQYVAMRIAADAGLAPRIHAIDETAGVAVIDFIAEQPLTAFPGGPAALARALGEMVRRLQATPIFPHFIDYPDIVSRIWAHICRSGLFAPGVLDAHSRRLAEIRSVYAWDPANAVSSHNDLLPRNLLFDGQRLWLIDWESACRSDPLVDIATTLDNFAPTPELEAVVLRAWLGREPDRQLRERLSLIRALTRLFYAGVQFSAVAAGPRSAPETDLAAPTLSELQQALRDGRLQPDALETRHVLGKMFLAAFLFGTAAPGLPPPFSQFKLKHGPIAPK